MDALVILGLVIWATVVVVLVNILLETAKWEDKKLRSKLEKPAFEFDAATPMGRDTCYDRCMRDFLWSPHKKAVCMETCGL